jgi:hypothetical protein
MKYILIFVISFYLVFISCNKKEEKPNYPQTTRLERIPADAVKVTPETDLFPPILHTNEWEDPIPLGPEINTAGAEDSPFIPIDRDELYFFFTPDVGVSVEQQIYDEVTGIYVSEQQGSSWGNAERVWLQDAGKLSLDGAEFVQGGDMLFISAREGYTGLHWFSANYVNGVWSSWQQADFEASFDVGELHIHNDELYYHSSRSGGAGKLDIWKLTKTGALWQQPENITAVNTAEDEGWPYISPDGNELWITRTYLGAAALFRSKKINDEWETPELIVSQFAGEATLDNEGNLYFVHHYFKNSQMIEADIYVAYKK